MLLANGSFSDTWQIYAQNDGLWQMYLRYKYGIILGIYVKFSGGVGIFALCFWGRCLPTGFFQVVCERLILRVAPHPLAPMQGTRPLNESPEIFYEKFMKNDGSLGGLGLYQ